jgi:hypothetical protein
MTKHKKIILFAQAVGPSSWVKLDTVTNNLKFNNFGADCINGASANRGR